MLFLESVFIQEKGKTKFSRFKALSHSDMERLVNIISHRIAHYLEQAGLFFSTLFTAGKAEFCRGFEDG